MKKLILTVVISCFIIPAFSQVEVDTAAMKEYIGDRKGTFVWKAILKSPMHTDNKCYRRITYTGAYLFDKIEGWCCVARWPQGTNLIRAVFNFDNDNVATVSDFMTIPAIFGDSLKADQQGLYTRIAFKIGKKLFRNVVKRDRDYNHVLVLLRAKNREKYFYVVVKRSGKHKYSITQKLFVANDQKTII